MDEGPFNSAKNQNSLVRRLNQAFFLAPKELASLLPQPLPEEELERLLECEGNESAFFRLADGRLNWLVSQNHTGTAIATIGIPGLIKECTREGSTATVALCKATASATLIVFGHQKDDAKQLSLSRLN